MMDQTNNIEKLEQELSTKKLELEKLRLQQKHFDELPDNKKVAEILHDELCHASHEDQCGYTYENWSNPGASKSSWLRKADRVLRVASIENVRNIFKAIKDE